MAVQISGNDITVPRDGSFTRNVTIGGTLTYEDVTNIDSVGLVTARSGIEIGARPGVGASISVDGNAIFSGITTATTVKSTTGIVTTLTATSLTVDSGTTNTCATFKSTDSGAVINLTDDSARSSIEQNGTDLKIISDTDAGDADSTIKFQVDSSTKAIINSSGNLLLGTGTAAISAGIGMMIANSAGARIKLCDSDSGVTSSDGFEIISNNGGTAYVYNRENTDMIFGTNNSERVRITSTGLVGVNETPTIAQFQVRSSQLGGTSGNTQEVLRLHSPDVTNTTSYRFTNYRVSDGTSHSSSELRFRRHVDATDMGYFGLGDGYASIGYGTAEKVRIDSSGNVILNHTASRTYNGHVAKLQIQGTNYSGSTLAITSNSGDNSGAYLFLAKQRSGSTGGSTVVQSGDLVGQLRFLAGDGTDLESEVANITVSMDGTPGGNDVPGKITFATTNDGGNTSTERYRIHNNGVHSWNNTTVPYNEHFHFYAGTSGKAGMSIYFATTTDEPALVIFHGRSGASGGSLTAKLMQFRNSSGNENGSIASNASVTAYNTSSDYRLKENEVTISDAISKVKQLKPYTFNFKVTPDQKVDGFFAHEAQEVIPYAVLGEKDAEDMQQMDYGKLTPLLTAALQEAITEIESLKSRLDTAGL